MSSEKSEIQPCIWKGHCIYSKRCGQLIKDYPECVPVFHSKCPSCGGKIDQIHQIKLERCLNCGWRYGYKDLLEVK